MERVRSKVAAPIERELYAQDEPEELELPRVSFQEALQQQKERVRVQEEQEQEEQEEEEEEEIHAREFILNGVKYLIDENTSDIYDIHTQDCIGKFDTTTNSIILLV